MRPKDWDEISFNLGFNTPYPGGSAKLGIYGDGVEAGADAMLKALKSQEDTTYWKDPNGWEVFIPDEE